MKFLIIFLLNILLFRGQACAGWYSDFLDQATAIQAEQPHWVTPVFTTTPRLEQEFRTDFVMQSLANGVQTENFGNGKGLEFIPLNNVEVILGVPPYLIHNSPADSNGWGDMPTLIKYRILSANAAGGDYILTFFWGTSVPVGSAPNGGAATIITPSISAGKGFGDFDIQSTLGLAIPLADEAKIGKSLSWNTAFQEHILPYFWPELEFVVTHFYDTKNNGNTQAFIAPGILFGRFKIHERTALTVGLGYQAAITSFHTYNNEEVLSVRLPF